MMLSKVVAQLFPFLASLAFIACAKDSPTPESTAQAASPAPAAAGPVTLQGSGASFPAPIYSRWFKEFGDKNPNIRVNYQATGSGAGIKAFIEGQTDFGASDAAMTDEEIKQASDNVRLLPMTAGNIVLAYNLEGVTKLQLSRAAYAGIFLGKIKKWNDPEIVKTNAGVSLPDKDITVAHRSDGSGTTFVFTQHLSAISDAWKTSPGKGTSVDWPVGVGGRKNDGVAALIAQTPGSIGYIEYSFAVGSKMTMAELENKAGKFIPPTLAASAKALAAVTLPEDMRAWVTDPEGEDSYPIVTYTWILAKKKYSDPAKAEALKKLLDWCVTDGQKLSESLYYVPLPEAVSQKVKLAIATISG
jgi:phosphate transport system substrate-binding protein